MSIQKAMRRAPRRGRTGEADQAGEGVARKKKGGGQSTREGDRYLNNRC